MFQAERLTNYRTFKRIIPTEDVLAMSLCGYHKRSGTEVQVDFQVKTNFIMEKIQRLEALKANVPAIQ